MDLNRTTTISSRRKTFTVPSNNVHLPFMDVTDLQSNRTFSTTGGDAVTQIVENNNMTFVSSVDGYVPPESSHNGFPVVAGAAAQENPENEGARRLEMNPPPPPERFNVIELSADFEDLNEYLDALVRCRNQNAPFFLRDEGLNTSSASSIPLFETSEVHEPSTDSMDLEIERLKLQEANLKEELTNLTKKIAITEKSTAADIERYEKKTKEFERKTTQNKEAAKEARAKKAFYKKEAANYLLLSKDLVERMDFPKRALQRFCRVSERIRCEDEEFCRQFSGGKCLSKRGEEPK